MDFKAQIARVVEDGLTRVKDVREASERYRSGWESKKREVTELLVDIAKELQLHRWCEAGVGGDPGLHSKRLTVKVDPKELPGPIDLAERLQTYTLTFRPDFQDRRIFCDTEPKGLLDGVLKEVHRNFQSMSFDLDDLSRPMLEARVRQFVEGIMRDLERRAVR